MDAGTADATETEAVLVVGALHIDVAGHRATLRGRPLGLSSSQFELLAILVANRRRVVSRAELSERLGLERGRSVDVMLSTLRRELGCEFVRNVRKRGWILIPEALGTAEPRRGRPGSGPDATVPRRDGLPVVPSGRAAGH